MRMILQNLSSFRTDKQIDIRRKRDGQLDRVIINRQIDIQKERETDIVIDRQVESKIDRGIDRQMDKQIDR